MPYAKEGDYDNCECGHIRWQHLKRQCKGIDSYDCLCDCTAFQLNPEDLLQYPQDIIGELNDTYTPDGILTWLRSPNKNLERCSPLVLIRAGRKAEVLAEAQRVGSGMVAT